MRSKAAPAPAAPELRVSTQPAGFEALLRTGQLPLLRYLFGRLDAPDQAEDLAQETLMRAFCAFRDGARPTEPLAWLLGIARNVLLESWRGERYRRRLQEHVSRAMGPSWAGSLEDVWLPGMAAGSSSAGEETGTHWNDVVERRLIVAEALDSLPPELRAPVLLHYFADLPLADVAAHLGTTPGAVKMRLLRARLALKPKLNDEFNWRKLMSPTAATTRTAPATPATQPPSCNAVPVGRAPRRTRGDGLAPIYQTLSIGIEVGGLRYATEPLSAPAFSGEVPTLEDLRGMVDCLLRARTAGPRPLCDQLSFWAASDPFEHPDPVAVWSLLRDAAVGPPEFALIPTDGRTLGTDPDWRAILDGLKAAGLRHLWLTFAGLEPTHDSLSGRPGAFAAAVRSLERARDAGLSRGANILVSTESIGQLDELVRLVYSFRADPSDLRGASVYVPHWSPFSPDYESLRPQPEHIATVPPELKRFLSPVDFWHDPEAFTEAALTRRALETSADPSGAPAAPVESTPSTTGLLISARADVLLRGADERSLHRVANLREQTPEQVHTALASLEWPPAPPPDAELARRFGDIECRTVHRSLGSVRRKWIHAWQAARVQLP